MSSMEPEDRSARIIGLGRELYKEIERNIHGCHWTEVGEACGLAVKVFATAVASASDANPQKALELHNRIAESMAAGFNRPALVVFPPDTGASKA